MEHNEVTNTVKISSVESHVQPTLHSVALESNYNLYDREKKIDTASTGARE